MVVWSICSGIGAPEVAWADFGWTFALMSEIESFPRRVLMTRHGAQDARYERKVIGPVLWGDFTAIKMRHIERLGIALPDILVAGTPCQAFSVVGLRKSLDDDRGNLTLAFVRLANAIDNVRSRKGLKPLTILWENVPGVLNVRDNAFGCFIGAMVGADSALIPTSGLRWTDVGLVSGPRRSAAWRLLDAQFFGLAQRRKRVFLVARSGDVSYPAGILLNEPRLHGNHPPRREEGQGTTHNVAPSVRSSGPGFERGGGFERTRPGDSLPDVAGTVSSRNTAGGGLGTDFELGGGVIACDGRND